MKVGIVGDIHLERDAFEQTLAGPLAGCERLIQTGDFVDRGPADPGEMLGRLLELECELLIGNHELVYLGGPVFANMVEDRGIELAPRLRELVLDGRLRAAAVVDEVLCVHAGISLAFWKRELRKRFGDDPNAIAQHLNRTLLAAVHRRDFRDPAFGALRDGVRGPFWANVHDDLLAKGLPPLHQAVGHTVARPGWQGDKRGVVFPLEWGHDKSAGIGHLVLDV